MLPPLQNPIFALDRTFFMEKEDFSQMMFIHTLPDQKFNPWGIIGMTLWPRHSLSINLVNVPMKFCNCVTYEISIYKMSQYRLIIKILKK